MVFTWFSNGTTGPKQTVKQPKASLQPLKWENWQRVRSRSTGPSLCVFFASPPKNQDRTRKQETKKTKNKKQKKQNKHNTSKNKIANPKGGSSGRELGLVIFLFLVFLDSFSHCRDAKQKLSMVAQYLHSHCKMCQAEAVSACVGEQLKNCTLRFFSLCIFNGSINRPMGHGPFIDATHDDLLIKHGAC